MNEKDKRRIQLITDLIGDDVISLFKDKDVVEIMLNENGDLLVESHSKGIYFFKKIESETALNFMGVIADYNDAVVNFNNPLIEGSLPPELFNARFAGAISPVSRKPIFSIRLLAKVIYTLDDYVENKILTLEQKSYIEEAIRNKKNIVVSGGTGSGKTTLTNALLHYLSEISDLDERIIILEDTQELQCNAKNTVYLSTYFDADIDMTRLLKLTLRLRPNRIIIGEVRDAAALALLKAWNTGHPGGITTLHSNNVNAALLRLDQLVQEANVPSQKELIREAVDIVIQIERNPTRRISEILDVKNGVKLKF